MIEECERCAWLAQALPLGPPVWCGEWHFPTISPAPFVQAHYVKARRAGTSHALAEMFALGQPPMSNTDREFLEATENGRQFQGQDWLGDFYRTRALEAGVNPTGKVYKSCLAEYPGDPRAWVSGKGDVQRLCEERGWGCDELRLPVRTVAERSSGAVAPDIINAKVQEVLSQTPEPSLVDTEDLREQVVERLTPHWAKPSVGTNVPTEKE